MTTENTPVLRARSTPAVAPTTATEAHSIEMTKAGAIARAGDLVPKAYRNNTGAVLLALGWADQHDIDPWTAMESMAFINGKRTITAEMQAALADRKGYRVTPTDVSDTAATVAVVVKATGEELGRATFTINDAKAMGLAAKDNWKKMPKAMLVARARTQAIRWYCPGVLVGTMDPDEALDHTDVADPVAVLTPDEPEPALETDDVTDAEVVEAEPVTDDAPADDELVARVRDAIAAAKQTGTWPEIATTLQEAGVPLQPHRLSAVQASFVLELTGEQETP